VGDEIPSYGTPQLEHEYSSRSSLDDEGGLRISFSISRSNCFYIIAAHIAVRMTAVPQHKTLAGYFLKA
jgi:hypothetical protein